MSDVALASHSLYFHYDPLHFAECKSLGVRSRCVSSHMPSSLYCLVDIAVGECFHVSLAPGFFHRPPFHFGPIGMIVCCE